VIGLVAARGPAASIARAGAWIRAHLDQLQGAGDLERTILALHACGVSVHSLPGGDPVSRLLRFRSADGSFGHLSNLTAFAVFALRAAGYANADPTVRAAGTWLLRQQNGDGGFGFATRGGGSDVDDTAAALQAIVDSGRSHGSAITRALAFLVRAQNADGGYPQQTGGESNAQSTAWAIQGLIAGGRDPRRLTRGGSRSPVAFLATLLAPDGSVRYSRTGAQTPVWVTAQALTALAGRPLPIGPPRVHAAAAGAGAPSAAAGAASTVGGAARAARASRASTRAGSPATATGLRPRESGRLDGLARSVGALLGALVAPIVR
jgi:energy-coupling factor transport system substrate-specific component